MVAIIFMLSLISCEEPRQDTAGIRVRLADSSPTYDGVLIDVQSVQADFLDDDEGWILLPTNKGTYNLLQLTEGIDTLLANGVLPQGTLNQLRLVLGNENYVVMAQDTLPLAVPSALQPGLKVQVDKMLLTGTDYTLRVDFNSSESIVKIENAGRQYSLKPVVRVISTRTTGA